MSDNLIDLNTEVQSLREAFNSLEQRLFSVEKILSSSSQQRLSQEEPHKPTSLPRVLLEKQAIDTNSSREFNEKAESRDSSEEPKQDASVAPIPDVSEKNLETEIGQYWLNRIGITTLVVGIIFLILYSFQYCNAPVKLLLGFVVASGLVLFGEKMAKNEKRKWYGHGLMGGGWALGYFIVYAMYYISDLKVIDYYPIEMALSLALSAAALIRAVKCRSEVVAILSSSLATYSICVSGPSLESNLPIVLIAALVSIVSIRQKWYGLFIWLTLVSFIAHIFASNLVYSFYNATANDNSFITFAYLLSLWSIFNTAMFFAEETEAWQRQSLTAGTCINALSFLFCIIRLTDNFWPEQRYLLIAGAGLFYLAMAPILKRRQLQQLTTVDLLLGLSFINLALLMKFTDSSMAVFFLFELALLAIIGLQYDIRAFRWFAIPVSLCFFAQWFQHRASDPLSESIGLTSLEFVLIGVLSAAIFASISWLYAKKKPAIEQKSYSLPYRDIYYGFASFAAVCTPSAVQDNRWALPFLSIQAVVSACLSIVYGEGFFWFVTILVALSAGFNLLFTISNWLWTPTLISVAACYSLYVYCRQSKLERAPLKTKMVSAVAGNLILTMLFLAKLSSFWLSTGLAAEGLLLLAAGLALRERVFRISGLLVLSLLTFKLLFVDLAQAGTLERIVSFIASGIVFLAASYSYSRFTEKFGIKK